MDKFWNNILQKSKKSKPGDSKETSGRVFDVRSNKLNKPRKPDFTSKKDVSTQSNPNIADKDSVRNSVRNSKQTFNMSQRANDSRLKVENWNYSIEGINNNDFDLGSSSLLYKLITRWWCIIDKWWIIDKIWDRLWKLGRSE